MLEILECNIALELDSLPFGQVGFGELICRGLLKQAPWDEGEKPFGTELFESGRLGINEACIGRGRPDAHEEDAMGDGLI